MTEQRVSVRERISKPRWLLLTGVLMTGAAGCSAMNGVNVGASVPLGGLVNVGVNKTIQEPAPATAQEKAPQQKGNGGDAPADPTATSTVDDVEETPSGSKP